MNPWLIPLTLPTLLQGWLVGLLSLTLGFSQYPSVKRGVLMTFWRPWLAKRWRYSTTLGAWMGMHPDHGGTTEFHEAIHIQQYETANVLAAGVCGIVAFWEWRLALILYAFSGMLWLLPNFLVGWVRYHGTTPDSPALLAKRFGRLRNWWNKQQTPAYYGSDHERFAYAATAIETARDGRPIGIE